ncbi:MAG: hypothetical protein EBZ69_00800 [Alphaproteobacteria bacterium]|nr:hypothetical protein [Alphaproteobacteria bacterium]
MTCCQNGGCKRQEPKGFTTTDAPVESLMDFKDIINLLSTMASTGVKNFAFKDAALERLAASVAQLAAENNYLKKLTALLSPANVELTGDSVTVSFGPGSAYMLSIPAGTEEQRKQLGAQFRILAVQLGAADENPDKQLNLF